MNTETENGMQVTFDASGQAVFLMPSVGVSEHPVRTSQLQESEQGLTETEAALCERFFGLFGKKGQTSPNGWSTKMLKECYRAIEDLTSLQYALKWGNWGTISSGRCLTRSITAFRRTGKEYTLSDILESVVNEKYFLSSEQMQKIVFTSTSSDTETATEETHKCSAVVGGVEALDTAAGGGRGHHTAIPIGGVCYGRSADFMRDIYPDYARTLASNKIDGAIAFGIDYNKDSKKKSELCIPILTPDRPNKSQNGRRFKENGEEAFTLTGQDRHGVAVSEERAEIPVIWYDKYKCYIAIRKLTPRECFRLQGWEDKYFERAQFVNSDSQLYKQAGNGVTVNVVYDIAKQLR